MAGECWTKEEIESLICQIVSENKILPELCIPGKSEAAVNNQRRRLKEAGRLDGIFIGRTLKAWTICELNRLINLTTEYSFSAAFIAQLQLVPGRSKDSVSAMMRRNGLGNPAVKARAQQARRLTESQREEVKIFLLGDGRLMPSNHIAEKWGVAQKTVNGYRTRLGIPLSWQQARSSEDYQQKQQQRVRKFARQARARWRQWRERREQRLEDLKQEMEHRPCPPLRRVCQTCRQPWFATNDFYYLQKKLMGRRVKATLSRTCRLCRSAQRRHIRG